VRVTKAERGTMQRWTFLVPTTLRRPFFSCAKIGWRNVPQNWLGPKAPMDSLGP
jgi:hypothetical protein